MPKISIVTPIYNSEKYLEECVLSLINQTFRDLEIILIDDGSTDSSPIICDKLAAADTRIKVLHNKNSGLGVSYNTGINMAAGEYIGFLESDDFADIHMYEDLYRIAEKYKPDIVKSAWFNCWDKQCTMEKDSQMFSFNSYHVFNIKSYPWLLQKQPTVWNGIYKTDFIRKNNIKYLETPGASFQDVSFTYKTFCLSNSIVITPDGYVYYRKDNENSSVNSKEKSEAIFWEYAEVDKFFDEHPEIKCWANEPKLFKQLYDYKWNYLRIKDSLKHDFIINASRDFSRYKKNNELSENFFRCSYNDELLPLLNLD